MIKTITGSITVSIDDNKVIISLLHKTINRHKLYCHYYYNSTFDLFDGHLLIS